MGVSPFAFFASSREIAFSRLRHEDAEERRLTRRREGDTMNVEEVSAAVVDAAFHLHRDLGPGLLESVYEAILARMLETRGLRVERQKCVAFDFHGMHFDGVTPRSPGSRLPGGGAEVRGERCPGSPQTATHLPSAAEPAIGSADQFRCAYVQRRCETRSEQSSGARVVAPSRESESTRRALSLPFFAASRLPVSPSSLFLFPSSREKAISREDARTRRERKHGRRFA